MPVAVKVCSHSLVYFWFLGHQTRKLRASVFCNHMMTILHSATPVFFNALPSMYVPAVIKHASADTLKEIHTLRKHFIEVQNILEKNGRYHCMPGTLI